jgi:hypothetical protein
MQPSISSSVLSDVTLVDMPSLRVAAVSGPMASAEDVHPIHKKFVDLMISDVPRALSLTGVQAPSGGNVRTGALVYGDYSKSEPVMVAFKQCLFVGQGIVPMGDKGPNRAFEALRTVDPAASVEDTSPGLYAVATHSGEYSNLAAAVRAMVYQQFPKMGVQHSGGPIVEFYHGPGPEGLPVTDIAIPVNRS